MDKKNNSNQRISDIEKKLNIVICDEQAKHYFANFILTVNSQEEIILGFGNRRVRNLNEIEVINYFHLTIPHLKRLNSLLAEKIEEIDKKDKA